MAIPFSLAVHEALFAASDVAAVGAGEEVVFASDAALGGDVVDCLSTGDKPISEVDPRRMLLIVYAAQNLVLARMRVSPAAFS